ncbi:MAG: sugar transferase [Clostridia bacterium]|nr:sugar transferase [Clostridia bacterium]
MYKNYVKRLLDIFCALAAITVFSWLYLILTVLGAIAMKGNPFFLQPRPGKNEKVFNLIKFRTMDNTRDAYGNLLPDSVRLNRYGRFLRKTSLDELPEAFNILKGDMSIVGPRPLLVKYLPLYSEEQRHRHDVRPGLSGLAQINGRNGISWEEKFAFDVEYTKKVSFLLDVKIVVLTVWKAFVKSEGISQQGEATMEEFAGTKTQ